MPLNKETNPNLFSFDFSIVFFSDFPKVILVDTAVTKQL